MRSRGGAQGKMKSEIVLKENNEEPRRSSRKEEK